MLRRFAIGCFACLVMFAWVAVPVSAGCPPPRGRDLTFGVSPAVFINYKITGSGNDVIVALHGFGGSLDTWNDIEPFLSDHRRIYAVDLPGFGLSAHPPGFSYTVREQAESISAFVQFVHDQNPGSRLTILGHSFGGSIALVAAVALVDQNRPILDSLVLIDAPGFPQNVHLPIYLRFLTLPIINRLVLHLVPSTVLARTALRRGIHRRDLISHERVCQYAQFINAPGGHDSLIKTIRQLRAPEVAALSARIAEIQTPSLILWGTHDMLLSPNQAELLHGALRESRPVVYLDAGHLLHEEQPEATTKLMEEFLESLKQPSALSLGIPHK